MSEIVAPPAAVAFTQAVPFHCKTWLVATLVIVTSVRSSRDATVDATPGMNLVPLYLRTWSVVAPVVSTSIPSMKRVGTFSVSSVLSTFAASR